MKRVHSIFKMIANIIQPYKSTLQTASHHPPASPSPSPLGSEWIKSIVREAAKRVENAFGQLGL
jgi:hypothetical protein